MLLTLRVPINYLPQGFDLIIGISGPIGSGKTTAAKYLASTYRLSYLRYSKVLGDLLNLKAPNRNTLREAGWNVMSRDQQTLLNRQLLAVMEEGVSYVVDGLRHPIDFETLKEYSNGPFFFLYIDARSEIRWHRLKMRGDFDKWEDFQAAQTHPVEAYVPSLTQKAFRIIQNEGSVKELYEKLDAVYQTLGEEK